MKTRLLFVGVFVAPLFWLSLIGGVFAYHQPSRAFASGVLGLDSLRFTDSLGNQQGNIIELIGKGHQQDAGPTSIEMKSLLADRGSLLLILPNGSPAKDTDSGIILYGSGPGPFVPGTHEYLEVGTNYGKDGTPDHYVIGQLVENGGTGKRVRLLSGGRTVLNLMPTGRAQFFYGLDVLTDTGRPAVSLNPDGITLLHDGTLKHVTISDQDSCGVGYRCLRVSN